MSQDEIVDLVAAYLDRRDEDPDLTPETYTRELGAREVVGKNNIVKISLVGVGMRSHAGIASKMFAALAGESINIQMISTSEIKISVVVDEKYLELGVRAPGFAEIRTGLDAGEVVITEGTQKVRNGAAVRVVSNT